MYSKQLASSLEARAAELDRALAKLETRDPEAESRVASAGDALASTLYDAADLLTNTSEVKALHSVCGRYYSAARGLDYGWTPANKAGFAAPGTGKREVSFTSPTGRRQIADVKDAASEEEEGKDE